MGDPLVTGGLLLVMANGTISAVAGDGEGEAVDSGAKPPDLSGLPPCVPPRPVPNEPLWGEPATRIDVETHPIEPIGDPPVTEDGRPVESTTWPQMLTANLPVGEQATVEEVGGVRATLDAMGDCTRRPEGTDQIPAFFSVGFFRRGIGTPDPDGYELTWNRQPEGDELDQLQVFTLDDGRVGASTAADSGSGIFLAFVEVDGAWLIDEFYEEHPEYFEGPIG